MLIEVCGEKVGKQCGEGDFEVILYVVDVDFVVVVFCVCYQYCGVNWVVDCGEYFDQGQFGYQYWYVVGQFGEQCGGVDIEEE